MSNNNLDKLAILAALLTITADFIFLIVELGNQQKAVEESQKQATSDKKTSVKLQELENEIISLKLEIKKMG